MRIKCIVAGTNANGEPDLFFGIVEASEERIENGDHYDRIKEAAEEAGYEGPFVAFDQQDYAGESMLPLFVWKTASIFKLE